MSWSGGCGVQCEGVSMGRTVSRGKIMNSVTNPRVTKFDGYFWYFSVFVTK